MQRCILAILSLAFCAGAQAVSEDVQLNLVTNQGVGQTIGSVKITETDRGLEFAPTLRALPPGKHGFHIHAEGSCQPAMKEGKAVAAGAAGGHYDPQHTGKHEGPLGTGHLGDLPLLVVNDALWHNKVAKTSDESDEAIIIREALEAVTNSESYTQALLPVGNGLLVAVKD